MDATMLLRRHEGRQCIALLREVSLGMRNLTWFWLYLISRIRSLFSMWIAPELRWGWSLGWCDVPICDPNEMVRTVDHLASITEELVEVRA